jgi:hypothetical protein
MLAAFVGKLRAAISYVVMVRRVANSKPRRATASGLVFLLPRKSHLKNLTSED